MNIHPSERMPAVVSFVHAARQGSFAAAARLQGISGAAVSKNVGGLEAALGVRLMNRTTRSLKLTAEGEAFLAQVSVAIDALDAAMDTVGNPGKQPSGVVRISVSTGFGMDYVLPLIPALSQQHPGLHIELDLDDRKVNLVKDGYDLALRGGKLEDSSLVSRKVGTLHVVLVASPAYLQRHGVPRSLDALAAHQHIAVRFLGQRAVPWQFRLPDGSQHAFVPNRALLTVSASPAAARAAVLDMGIAQVGLNHAWQLIQSGALKVVLPKLHEPSAAEIALHYPHRALLAPRVKATVDFLLKTLKANPALLVTPKQLGPYWA